MKVPMKSHRVGYEDEEDCCGYYDPDLTEARNCHSYRGGCSESDLRMSDISTMTGRECYQMWLTKEKQRQQVREDAGTPEEKAKRAEFLAGLRALL